MPNRRQVLKRLLATLILGEASRPFARDRPHIDSLAKPRADARGRFVSRATRSKTIDPQIAAIAEQVSTERLWSNVEALERCKTRWSYSGRIEQAANWIEVQFKSYGYPDDSVRRQPFKMPGGIVLSNILCPSEQSVTRLIMLCGHYDSVSDIAHVSAPGADDNASGISVILEAARILKSVPLAKGIIYAAFAGEEQGLIGSTACAEIASREGWPIDAVINLDMVGFVDPLRPSTIVIEFDQGNEVESNDAPSKSIAMLMAQAAYDFTTLTVEHTDIWNSDYMPFEAKGYPCVGLYDNASDQPFYHTANDTSDNVCGKRLNEVARLAVATVVQLAVSRNP